MSDRETSNEQVRADQPTVSYPGAASPEPSRQPDAGGYPGAASGATVSYRPPAAGPAGYGGTRFEHPGLGTWLGFSGLAIVAVAGLLVPSARRRS